MTTSIELSARSLASLLRPVIPFADQTGMMPVLATVKLTTRGDYLTAGATDRFRVAMNRTRLDAPAEFDALVPVSALRQLLTVFKPNRHVDPVVTLTVEDGKLTAEQAYGMDFQQAKFTFGLEDGDYPKLASLIASHRPEPSEKIAVHAKYLADFKAAVTFGDPLKISFGGELKPVIITAGEDFIGAVMPVKITDESESRANALDNWLDFLGRPVAEAVSA